MGWLGPRVEHDREHGATLVEFALVVPILMFLIFGIVEFGRYVAIVDGVNTAAREGARFGSASTGFDDCQGIKDAAVGLSGVANLDVADISVDYFDLSGALVGSCVGSTLTLVDVADPVASTDRISVTAATTFQTGIPIVGAILGPRAVNATDRRTIFEGELLEG